MYSFLKLIPIDEIKLSIDLDIHFFFDKLRYSFCSFDLNNMRTYSFIFVAVNCWHDQSNSGCGHDKVVSMDKLREVYLDEDDTLSVAIEFEVISATSYSPINYSAII